MDGDGNAVNLHKENNKNPGSKCRSICILDGDSRQKDGTNAKIYHLPGQCPENYIFDSVLTLIDNTKKKCEELCLLLHKSSKPSIDVLQNIKSIKNSNRDPHLLYTQVAERIGFVSEIIVISAFLNLWARNYDDESQRIIKIISSNLS
jgi:hypothetical protein